MFCDLYTAVIRPTFHYTGLFQQFGEVIEICFISQSSRWDWFKHILFMTEHDMRTNVYFAQLNPYNELRTNVKIPAVKDEPN